MPRHTSRKDSDTHNKRREREVENARFLEEDDGEALEHEISTSVNYLTVPVGKRVTGVFVEFRPDVDPKGNPTERPVLLVNGETCVLPGHFQLVAALKKVSPGQTVRVSCLEKVTLPNGKSAWNYSVSTGDLPF